MPYGNTNAVSNNREGNDFFSSIGNIIGQISGVVRGIGDIVNGPPPIWSTGSGGIAPPIADDPTFRGGNGGTTANQNGEISASFHQYLPLILIGGGILIAILIFKG